MQILKSNSLI